jgi:hypothetical protein
MNQKYDVRDRYGRKVGTITSQPSTGFSIGVLIVFGILFAVIPFYVAGKGLIKGWDSVGLGTKIFGILVCFIWIGIGIANLDKDPSAPGMLALGGLPFMLMILAWKTHPTRDEYKGDNSIDPVLWRKKRSPPSSSSWKSCW